MWPSMIHIKVVFMEILEIAPDGSRLEKEWKEIKRREKASIDNF